MFPNQSDYLNKVWPCSAAQQLLKARQFVRYVIADARRAAACKSKPPRKPLVLGLKQDHLPVFSRAALGAGCSGTETGHWTTTSTQVDGGAVVVSTVPASRQFSVARVAYGLQRHLALAARPRRTCRSEGKDSNCKIQGRSTVFYLKSAFANQVW